MDANSKLKLIEKDKHRGSYDMWRNEAIIEHPIYGRIYVTEVFCGIDTPSGGAYRWGQAIKVLDTDTLESLHETDTSRESPTERAAIALDGYDNQRPNIDLNDKQISIIANFLNEQF